MRRDPGDLFRCLLAAVIVILILALAVAVQHIVAVHP
jgi:hypothetical protein